MNWVILIRTIVTTIAASCIVSSHTIVISIALSCLLPLSSFTQDTWQPASIHIGGTSGGVFGKQVIVSSKGLIALYDTLGNLHHVFRHDSLKQHIVQSTGDTLYALGLPSWRSLDTGKSWVRLADTIHSVQACPNGTIFALMHSNDAERRWDVVLAQLLPNGRFREIQRIYRESVSSIHDSPDITVGPGKSIYAIDSIGKTFYYDLDDSTWKIVDQLKGMVVRALMHDGSQWIIFTDSLKYSGSSLEQLASRPYTGDVSIRHVEGRTYINDTSTSDTTVLKLYFPHSLPLINYSWAYDYNKHMSAMFIESPNNTPITYVGRQHGLISLGASTLATGMYQRCGDGWLFRSRASSVMTFDNGLTWRQMTSPHSNMLDHLPQSACGNSMIFANDTSMGAWNTKTGEYTLIPQAYKDSYMVPTDSATYLVRWHDPVDSTLVLSKDGKAQRKIPHMYPEPDPVLFWERNIVRIGDTIVLTRWSKDFSIDGGLTWLSCPMPRVASEEPYGSIVVCTDEKVDTTLFYCIKYDKLYSQEVLLQDSLRAPLGTKFFSLDRHALIVCTNEPEEAVRSYFIRFFDDDSWYSIASNIGRKGSWVAFLDSAVIDMHWFSYDNDHNGNDYACMSRMPFDRSMLTKITSVENRNVLYDNKTKVRLTSTDLIVSTDMFSKNDDVNVALLDIRGKATSLNAIENLGTERRYDVSAIPTGAYVIRISTSLHQHTGMVLIAH